MSLFTIADLHLSLGTNKPMDIFHGWNNYVDRLEKNWRALITDNDTIVIGGDISWAMKLNETYSDFAFINSLPGRKILVKGNHDYWWQTKKKWRIISRQIALILSLFYLIMPLKPKIFRFAGQEVGFMTLRLTMIKK